jgi:sortase (surface protein transpeptidase)
MRIRFNPTRLLFALGILLTAAGLFGVIPGLYFSHNQNGSKAAQKFHVIKAAQPAPAEVPAITGHPVSISIPSLNMNLPVIDGYYNKNSGAWTLTLNKAQFATPSVEPNNKTGMTLIYGHYRPEVFARLHTIQPDSTAVITTANGYTFTYKYTGNYPAAPNDTSIFTYAGAPMLTIQTCSGTYFQNRQMYQFTFQSVQKS